MREAVVGDIRTLVELMAEFYAESGYVLDRARADVALHGAALWIRDSGESGSLSRPRRWFLATSSLRSCTGWRMAG